MTQRDFRDQVRNLATLATPAPVTNAVSKLSQEYSQENQRTWNDSLPGKASEQGFGLCPASHL